MKDHINTLLSKFDPISLKEMDAVSLMNRTDTKYAMHTDKLEQVLGLIQGDYSVLEVDGLRLMRYDNIYFDTDEFEFYRKHHRGGLNRFKVRARSYTDSGLCFYEIKFKNNKGRTIKNRVRTEEIKKEFPALAQELITTYTPFDHQDLAASSTLYFNRFTLAAKDFSERCTIDSGLTVTRQNAEVDNRFSNLIIVEVKQSRYDRSSKLVQALKACGVRPLRLSKYCLAMATSGRENIKVNAFKPRLRKINKILDGNAA